MDLQLTSGRLERRGLLLTGALWGCLVLASPAWAQPADGKVPAGVEYLADLTYRTVGSTQLQLDLARPARGKGPFPAVVILNGGCWMDLNGNRKACLPLLLRLASHGHVAVAISHRSAAASPFPAQIHDAKAAVRWLRKHASKYGVDSDRIAALGFSSGGHLACLLGATTPADGLEEPGADPQVSSQVQAVVAYYAPTDLARLRQQVEKGLPNWIVAHAGRSVFNSLLGQDRSGDLASRASPIHYARREAAPLLLIHGSVDLVVPCEQSERYADRLKAAGASVRLLKISGAGHSFGSGCGSPAGQQADDAALTFLRQQLQTQTVSK